MLKIAVLGFGVVGSGTVELFYKNKKKIEEKSGQELDIKYILDLRDFPDSPYNDKIVHDINIIADDDEVSVIAEAMGGVEPAYSFTKLCLERGKSVVSSNKELVAQKGAELLRIAMEHNRNYFFEASVGGAIPIIRPLHKCLAANDISEVTGILNGTTNFILTKMFSESMSFDEALALAQKLGYAEKDPTADVDGHDSCRKICILASLVFGSHVFPKDIYVRGIRDVSSADVLWAGKFGYEIKLVASVRRTENGKILPFVSPMLVARENLLASVDDVFNAVMVYGDAIDRVMFYGRGAGKFPTASAVVSDIIEAAKHERTVFSQFWTASENTDFIENFSTLKTSFFVRMTGNEPAFASKFSIYENDGNEFVALSDIMTVGQFNAVIDELAENGVKANSVIPVYCFE